MSWCFCSCSSSSASFQSHRNSLCCYLMFPKRAKRERSGRMGMLCIEFAVCSISVTEQCCSKVLYNSPCDADFRGSLHPSIIGEWKNFPGLRVAVSSPAASFCHCHYQLFFCLCLHPFAAWNGSRQEMRYCSPTRSLLSSLSAQQKLLKTNMGSCPLLQNWWLYGEFVTDVCLVRDDCGELCAIRNSDFLGSE